MQRETIGANIGAVLAILYAIFAMAAVITSFTCTADICRAAIVFPLFPWPILAPSLLNTSLFLYPLFLLLNAVILYLFGLFIGAFAEWFFKKDAW